MSKTFTSSFWFFGVRAAAVCVIVAASLFLGDIMARAQDAADENDEMIFDDEEFFDDDETFDAELLDEEAVAEDGEAVVEDESAFADETADEGGFLDTLGDFFGGIKGAAVGAYETATDFLGFGDEEGEAPQEEAAAPAPEKAAAIPEDTDVEAPTAAPKTNAFTLRVSIAARDVAAVLRSARGAEPTRYEPRAFDIPERGLVTIRAEQDGPLFCLAFDLSEFRVAAALSDALFEVGGVKGAAEPSSAEAPAGKEGINTACVGLPALSATAPLVIGAVFK